MKKIRGYTQGAFDTFHIGHLNLIKAAAKLCDELTVGVNTDELIEEYKLKKPLIPLEERMAIVEALKYVDGVVPAETLDKEIMHDKIGFDRIFIGDDWKGSERWRETEKKMALRGVEVIYLRHTDGISSSILREKITEEIGSDGK